MTFAVLVAMSLLIGVPALFALFKVSQLEKSVIPFVLMLQVGFISEIVSLLLITCYGNNIVSYSVSGLLGGVLCIIQLAVWDQRRGRKWLYMAVTGLIIVTGFLEWLIVEETGYFFSYLTIVQSLIIIALSMNIAIRRLTSNIEQISRDPIFIICAAFVIFNSYAMLTELYLLLGFKVYSYWHKYVADIFSFVNFFVNLLYLYVVICMSRKIRCSS